MPRGSLYLTHADGPPCDARHSSFHQGKNSVRPTFYLLWISHIRNSVRLMFHLLRIFHIRCLMPDGRGGRFNFPSQTCPDPLIALTQRVFFWKLKKLTIQCFKRCAIQSWNERVTAIGSRSLQAEGRMLHGCENVVLLLRKFHSHFAQCRGVLLKLPDMCDRHFEIFLL